MPNSIICVIFYSNSHNKTAKTITSLCYSNWNAKIIWFALLIYCITCHKCCEDHKERIEIGAHDVGPKMRTAYSGEEKTKGDLIAILPSPKGEYENSDSSQKCTMKRRGDSHKLQGNWIWGKNSPWRWFNARTDCPENLGISILEGFQISAGKFVQLALTFKLALLWAGAGQKDLKRFPLM